MPVCVEGCFCRNGFVRDEFKNCVSIDSCPKKLIKVKSENFSDSCNEDEQYLECGSPCQPTCVDPIPSFCAAMCLPGCFCKQGLIRNAKGKCVRFGNCP